MSTGTMLMTERQSRKGFRTPKSLEDEAKELEALAADLRSIATVLRRDQIANIDVDGVGKFHRALSLIFEYLAKVDSAVAITRRLNR